MQASIDGTPIGTPAPLSKRQPKSLIASATLWLLVKSSGKTPGTPPAWHARQARFCCVVDGAPRAAPTSPGLVAHLPHELCATRGPVVALEVPKSFDEAMEDLPIDADSFIVIITRGHRHDRVVLEQALRTDAGYIGMIGSLRKRDAIYAALREEGVSAEDIRRVHSPIGLPIKAETPEEIAVSVVAEMIAERAIQQE